MIIAFFAFWSFWLSWPKIITSEKSANILIGPSIGMLFIFNKFKSYLSQQKELAR